MGRKTDEQAAHLIEAIKSDIIVGRLRPRERLLEEELTLKSQASRHVVRTAFATLEQMGLILRRPNRGAIVRDFSVEQVEEIYDVRKILQAEAARRIPMPVSEAALAEIRQIHTEYCETLARGDLLQLNALNDAFHRRIWALCPNRYMADTIDRLWIETTGIRWYGVGDPDLLVHSRSDHGRMIQQLETSDREGFVALSVDHIIPPLEAFKRAHAMTQMSPANAPTGLQPTEATNDA